MDFRKLIEFIRETFKEDTGFIALHAPYFGGNEKKYVNDTIDSTFVSSVGAYVTKFEEMMCAATGARYAVATVNGTTALHLALVVAGVKPGDEVISQSLTFVATANAISHAGGIPVFLDVDRDTLGLSPESLRRFLENSAFMNDEGHCINRRTGRHIKACLPMHTFGFPLRIDEIASVCAQYNIVLVEDAAESIGSYYKGKHTGNFGALGTFSFNGNKTITCGGGGAIITNDEAVAKKAKHLSTTAKIPHAWEFVHDTVAYNYRMPNINAALACAQMEQLDVFLANKNELADKYREFFRSSPIQFVESIADGKANFWLNTIILPDRSSRDELLEVSNAAGVMTRPVWQLMHKLPMYAGCEKDGLENSIWLEERVVNIPSSVRFK